MKNIVIGIIGCGAIANQQHLPRTAENANVTVKYACDIRLERAEAAQRKYGIPHACADYREVLGDKEVEAVLILTPNYSHYTIAMDALKAGKHVFVEKPITVNYALSCEMADEADRRGLILDVGVCNRFNRSVELIKQRIESGALGKLYHICISFRSFRSIPGLGGDFTTKEKAGGGVLIDWGVHFVDLAMYAAGLPKVKTVSATAYSALGKDISAYTYKNMWAGPAKLDGVCDVDDFVTGLIRTAGPSISLTGAWAQNIDKEEMYVDFLGDKAGIRFDYGALFTQYGARDGVLYAESADFNIPNMYDLEEKAFFAAVKGEDRSRNKIRDVLETMKILDAVYRSADEGREIVLD